MVSHREAMGLSMNLDPRGYVRGAKDIVSATALMGRAYINAATNGNLMLDQMLKSKKGFDSQELAANISTATLTKYAGAASIAGLATATLGFKMHGMLKSAAEFQKTLVDINVSQNNFAKNFSNIKFTNTLQGIKQAQRGLTDLNETARAYFTISSAGLQGVDKMGRDIAQQGVKYAQMYQALSRGRISLEEAASFIPELVAKTNASMNTIYNNSSTELERYIDMIGRAEVMTKLKMENIRDILDATGTSWKNLGVGFAAGLSVVGQQMTAGQSARQAGQSARSLFEKFHGDIGLLGAHEQLYGNTEKVVQQLGDLNRHVLKHGKELYRAYGGEAKFQDLVAGILDGTIVAYDAQKQLQGLSMGANAKTAMSVYINKLSDLGGDEQKGTRQMKRLLLALDTLFGEGTVGSESARTSGRKAYEELILSVKNGTISVNDMFSKISERMDVVDRVDPKKGFQVLNWMFGDQAPKTAFMNLRSSSGIQIQQDIFEVDKSGKRVRVYELPQARRAIVEKMIAEGTAKVMGDGLVKLYTKGDYVRGIQTLPFLEASINDSENFSKNTYELSMKTFSNTIGKINADFKTMGTLIGGHLVDSLTGFAGVIAKLSGTATTLTKEFDPLAKLAASLGVGGLVGGGMMTAYLGTKAVGIGSKKLGSILGLPDKGVTEEIEAGISSQTDILKKLNTQRDNYIRDSKTIAKLDKNSIRDFNRFRGLAKGRRTRSINRLTTQYNAGMIDQSSYREGMLDVGYAYKQEVQGFENRFGVTSRQSALYKQAGGDSRVLSSIDKGISKTNRNISAMNTALRSSRGNFLDRAYMNMFGSPGAILKTMGALGLVSFGVSGLIRTNTFGLGDLLGKTDSGMSGLLQSMIQAKENRIMQKAGKEVGWENWLASLHYFGKGREKYVKLKEDIHAYRNWQSNAYRLNMIPGLTDMLVRTGQVKEGELNVLFGEDLSKINRLMMFKAFSPHLINQGREATDFVGNKDALLNLLKEAGVSKTTIGLLSDDKNFSTFSKGLMAIEGSQGIDSQRALFNSINSQYMESLAKERDPVLYSIHKWLEGAGGKYLYSIAAGVGMGAGFTGAIFGKAGLGAMIGLLAGTFLGILSRDNPGGPSDIAFDALMASLSTAGTVGLMSGFNPIAMVAGGIAGGGAAVVTHAMKNEKLKEKYYQDVYIKDNPYLKGTDKITLDARRHVNKKMGNTASKGKLRYTDYGTGIGAVYEIIDGNGGLIQLSDKEKKETAYRAFAGSDSVYYVVDEEGKAIISPVTTGHNPRDPNFWRNVGAWESDSKNMFEFSAYRALMGHEKRKFEDAYKKKVLKDNGLLSEDLGDGTESIMYRTDAYYGNADRLLAKEDETQRRIMVASEESARHLRQMDDVWYFDLAQSERNWNETKTASFMESVLTPALTPHAEALRRFDGGIFTPSFRSEGSLSLGDILRGDVGGSVEDKPVEITLNVTNASDYKLGFTPEYTKTSQNPYTLRKDLIEYGKGAF